jgi:tetratricopeptide (TPR) repeat protein
MISVLIAKLFLAGQLVSDASALTLTSNPGEIMLQHGQYFKYIRTIEQELTKSPSDACLHASLALGYSLLGQHRFSDEEMQDALALLEQPRQVDLATAHSMCECLSCGSSPNAPIDASAQIHYTAGRLEMANGNFKDAVTHFQTALVNEPDNAKIEYFLGVCLQALDRREGARTQFDHACRAASYSWPCRALAEIELDEKNATAALKNAEQAIRLEPTSAEAHFVAGKAAEALGDTSAAIPFFQRAAELDPSWAAPHYRLWHLYGKIPGKSVVTAQELARFQELTNDGQ